MDNKLSTRVNTMMKVVAVLALMVFISSFVEGRDWRYKSVKRTKRGYNGRFDSEGTYGGSDESVSDGPHGCSEENDRSNSGSREQLGYNNQGPLNDYLLGHRSYSKSSASASASAANQNHNYGV